MFDYEARRIIEALRSGISSRAAGQYFSSARSDITNEISKKINTVIETKKSNGMIISGKYGEGKTHLLNTVFSMAQSNNMVVSMISLSKETPFDKLYHVYPKLLHNTYLPKRLQPGFSHVLENLTPNGRVANEMLALTAKHLATDKLFYLFRAFLNTDNMDEKLLLQTDLEGDLINNNYLKQIYKRVFNEKAMFNTSFARTKHMDDYFSMLSYLFLQLGYNGWVIMFDETELIGRLGKKARLNAYKNIASFLFPEQYSNVHAMFSLFALTSSFNEDVLDGKHEYENAAILEQQPREAVERVLKAISAAEQLHPLNKKEITEIVGKLLDFHSRAYEWQPDFSVDDVLRSTENRAYLLRTRIRAAVEYMDQMYQYGQSGSISVGSLGEVKYSEDLPDLDELLAAENEHS